MTQFKPTLSGKADIDKLTFPLGASPKLDGIRAVIRDGKVLSRTLKPIRNKYVQSLFGHKKYKGLDGELIVGEPTADDCYHKTNSGVMSEAGEPDVSFHVFDSYLIPGGFQTRLASLTSVVRILAEPKLVVVPHSLIEDYETLKVYESAIIDMGYEGVMLRDINGPYKHGRSTQKEGYLLKLKRFEDSEAEIIGSIELFHNKNPGVRNIVGGIDRSTAQGGLVPAGILGAWEVRDIHTGVEFEIGTGFSAKERELYWKERMNILGSIVKYKFFPHGVKDKPRHPVYLGFRDEEDIG